MHVHEVAYEGSDKEIFWTVIKNPCFMQMYHFHQNYLFASAAYSNEHGHNEFIACSRRQRLPERIKFAYQETMSHLWLLSFLFHSHCSLFAKINLPDKTNTVWWVKKIIIKKQLGRCDSVKPKRGKWQTVNGQKSRWFESNEKNKNVDFFS